MTARRLAIGVLLAGVIALAWLSPMRRWALELVALMQAQGPVAAAIYGAIYVAAAVLLIPGSVLTLGAGFVYGPLWGSLLVVPAAIAGALAAFAIARGFARGWVIRRIARDPRFAALDRAIGRAGFKLTLLTRLSPVFPYGLLNYALGASDVRFRDYVVATTLGMLPGTILYVYLGSLVTSASALGERSGGGWLTWAGAAITVPSVIAVTVIGRRALRRELSEVTA